MPHILLQLERKCQVDHRRVDHCDLRLKDFVVLIQLRKDHGELAKDVRVDESADEQADGGHSRLQSIRGKYVAAEANLHCIEQGIQILLQEMAGVY